MYITRTSFPNMTGFNCIRILPRHVKKKKKPKRFHTLFGICFHAFEKKVMCAEENFHILNSIEYFLIYLLYICINIIILLSFINDDELVVKVVQTLTSQLLSRVLYRLNRRHIGYCLRSICDKILLINN